MSDASSFAFVSGVSIFLSSVKTAAHVSCSPAAAIAESTSINLSTAACASAGTGGSGSSGAPAAGTASGAPAAGAAAGAAASGTTATSLAGATASSFLLHPATKTHAIAKLKITRIPRLNIVLSPQ